MNKTRRWSLVLSATVLAVGGVVLAVPAHAAPSGSVVDNGDGTATVSWAGYATAGDVLVVLEPLPPYAIRPNSGTSGTLVISEGMSTTFGAGSASLPAGDYTIKLGFYTNPGTYVAQSSGTITIGSGGTSSGSIESAPVEASLSLGLAASGASCKSGSAATGFVGTWLTLPSADDCTSTTRSDAKLLGWSTSKDFPVAIAQRQVDNGWGAYEMTNESGRVTAVFIPAGRATFVSGSNSLYPIWAS